MTQSRPQDDRCTGPDLLRMLAAATKWLDANAAAVNALNVYPVPDGDTGTNMVLTLRTALREAEKLATPDVASAAQAFAQGALLGARGNSGVILSQYLQGLARGMEGLRDLDASGLARALAEAAQAAYRAMSHPVEGTILTVARAAGEGALDAAVQPAATLATTLDAAAASAQKSLEGTPDLLPVLKDAGVVDAGGQGLTLLLQAATAFRAGREPGLLLEATTPIALDHGWLERQREATWGFCTEFILREPTLSLYDLRREMAAFGESESIVEGERLVRVHLHTAAPEDVLARVGDFGNLEQVSVRDMDQQHKQFLAVHRPGLEAPLCGVVAVASGAGFVRVLRSLGAGAIIWGGQTMNPSAEEIAEAVDSLPAPEVIVLPNNKNIVPTARLAQGLVSKRLHVVPTLSLPQGVSSLLAYNPYEDAAANLARMDEAIRHVRWGEVTQAVRPTRVGDVAVRKGQTIGLLNDELVTAGESSAGVVCDLVRRMTAGPQDVLTLYYGAGVQPAEVAAVVEAIRRTRPGLEIETVDGGQPHYPYILALE